MAGYTSYLNINLLIFILWLPQAVYQIVEWVYWLQIKEYRLDRFWVFIKSKDGKESLRLKMVPVKILAILSAGVSVYIPLAVLSFLNYFFIKDILEKNVRVPVRTKRVEKIFITSFFGILITYLLLYYLQFSAFILGETLLVVGPLVGILWTIPLVNNAKNKEIEKTKSILLRYKPTVIGITGSYGKTTTKDFIFQLMSTEFNCLSTLKNQNTHFGILRRINDDLGKMHKFLIAETGAYRKGEICKIAEILKPSVAVITGIEPQHLDLFGSFENLKEAKYELVKSLKTGGSAFFNLTDKHARELYEKAKRNTKNIKVLGYGVSENESYDATSEIIKTTPDGIYFKLKINGENKFINTNIISRDLIENLTAAIFIARLFGVPWLKIEAECKKMKLPESTLNIYKTKDGIIVIDDSYNSSPSGFESALTVLKNIRAGKKYVATTGIIELGTESYAVHKRMGGIMDQVADMVLLRNKEFYKPIRNAMLNKNKLVVINRPEKILNYLKSNVTNGDVLLIEGKLPMIRNYYKSAEDL